MREMRVQFVNIDFNYGLENSNPNKYSSILRPFDRIIEKGKLTGYLSFIFLNTNQELSSVTYDNFKDLSKISNEESYLKKIPPSDLKVLGTICYTSGEKILFFPGYFSTYLAKFQKRAKPHNYIEKITIDHFSLEPSLKKWHITTKSRRLENLTVEQLNDNLIHWFGLCIKKEAKLESVYKHNAFAYLCPVKDAERRVNDIMNSLQQKDEHFITSPTLEGYNYETFFWHLDFYIKIDSEKKSSEKISPRSVFPDGTKLTAPSPELLPYYSYEMKIPKCAKSMVITAQTIPGTITDDILISYPHPNKSP